MYGIRFFATLLCLLFLFNYGKAGDSVRDSIFKEVYQLPNDSAKVDSLNRWANRYRDIKASITLELSNLASELAASLGYDKGELNSTLSAAGIYERYGLFDRSLEYYERAIDLAREVKDTTQLAWIYNGMGVLHEDNKSTELAYDYFMRSRETLLDLGLEVKATYPLINLGSMYHDMDSNAKALETYQFILDNHPAPKDRRRNAALFNNLGNLYLDLDETRKGLSFLFQALELKVALKNEYFLPNTTNNIAKGYMVLENFDSARFFMDSTHNILKRIKGGEYVLETMRLDANLQAGYGNYSEAYELMKQLNFRKDSVEKVSRAEEMRNLLAVFQVDEQNARIELLEKENEIINTRSRTLWLAIIGLVIVLILVSIIFFLNFRLNKKLKSMNQRLIDKNGKISSQRREIMFQKGVLEQKNQKLEDLIREKDGIIGFVAHDLKAPINKTLALLDLLGTDVGDEKKKLVEMIKDSNLNAQELIKDLLLINSIEQDDATKIEERIDLNKLILKKIESFKMDADRKNISLQGGSEDHDIHIKAYAKDLGRILDNFISNALKFSEPGTTVEVGVSRREGRLVVFVKDEGPGISPEDQGKMFKKFQKLSARPTGGESSHGLGLAIVKSLADKIGGEIKFQSELGKGTTFEIFLPS